MSNKISVTLNQSEIKQEELLEEFDLKVAKRARRFHESFDQYKQTPLAQLDNLAKELGIAKIFVKDESLRFNLNAFKVLGGSYAIGTYLAKRLNMEIDDLPYKTMVSNAIKEKLGDITFITATDGNHGRGIAWTANQLRQKAVIYMPKGSVQYRLDQIRDLGAEAKITNLHFDDTARLAFEVSKKNDWIMVQDTTFEGYEEFPKWCMQGYTTLAYETYEQLEAMNEKPTHIFIQSGAGSLAGGLIGFFSSIYGEKKPFTTIIEADNADCIKKTAEASDGKLHNVTGDISTMMAGLSVGEPCTHGWKILQSYADAFAACGDRISAKGIRVLANPIGNDYKIISGESGSVGVGLLTEILTNSDYEDLKNQLKLDENSKVLCFSTEGDTDPENYRDIVWNGKYPS